MMLSELRVNNSESYQIMEYALKTKLLGDCA